MPDFFGDNETETTDVEPEINKDTKIDLLATLLVKACDHLVKHKINLADIDIRLRIFYDKNSKNVLPVESKLADAYGKEKKIPALIDTDKMPFGKHKDKFMKDIPAQYLNWLKEQGCNNELVSNYIDNNWNAIKEDLEGGD